MSDQNQRAALLCCSRMMRSRRKSVRVQIASRLVGQDEDGHWPNWAQRRAGARRRQFGWKVIEAMIEANELSTIARSVPKLSGWSRTLGFDISAAVNVGKGSLKNESDFVSPVAGWIG